MSKNNKEEVYNGRDLVNSLHDLANSQKPLPEILLTISRISDDISKETTKQRALIQRLYWVAVIGVAVGCTVGLITLGLAVSQLFQ